MVNSAIQHNLQFVLQIVQITVTVLMEFVLVILDGALLLVIFLFVQTIVPMLVFVCHPENANVMILHMELIVVTRNVHEIVQVVENA